MKEIKLEYILKTSPAVLFSRISNPSGLAEWFADNVKVEGKICTFYWGSSSQQTEILLIIPDKHISFRWLDLDPEYRFSFDIVQDELTSDVSLIITDNVDDDDATDAKNLWSSQVAKLKQTIGS
ncbi:MAG: START-like domain-containing protein [Mariniphaga sp.]